MNKPFLQYHERTRSLARRLIILGAPFIGLFLVFGILNSDKILIYGPIVQLTVLGISWVLLQRGFLSFSVLLSVVGIYGIVYFLRVLDTRPLDGTDSGIVALNLVFAILPLFAYGEKNRWQFLLASTTLLIGIALLGPAIDFFSISPPKEIPVPVQILYWVSAIFVLMVGLFRYNALVLRNEEQITSLLIETKENATKLHDSLADLDTANKELVIKRDEALQASRVREQFLANATHELRTPLNAIVGLSRHLNKVELPATTHQYIGYIEENAELLRSLVDDLLDLSKIKHGGVSLKNESLDLTAIIKSIEGTLQPPLQNKPVRLTSVHPAADIPALRGDAARIKQILLNLISNALKFTLQGKVTLSLTLLEKTDTVQWVAFEVVDTGIGISNERLPYLFHEFSVAANATKDEYGGTGLGLSITKKLVDALGGSVGVTSAVGVGTTITVQLPLELSPAIDQQPDSAATVSIAITGPTPMILVAEDAYFNQIVIQLALTELGLPHVTANNGAEAIEKLLETHFDLVLLDLRMPVMDGMATAEHIRGVMPEPIRSIPIVALTAQVFEEEVARCMAVGMNGFLPKPFTQQMLAATLCQHLPALQLVVG
jgi:signal transduction histidine kinase/CheY-like chemotaxis protein